MTYVWAMVVYVIFLAAMGWLCERFSPLVAIGALLLVMGIAHALS